MPGPGFQNDLSLKAHFLSNPTTPSATWIFALPTTPPSLDRFQGIAPPIHTTLPCILVPTLYKHQSGSRSLPLPTIPSFHAEASVTIHVKGRARSCPKVPSAWINTWRASRGKRRLQQQRSQMNSKYRGTVRTLEGSGIEESRGINLGTHEVSSKFIFISDFLRARLLCGSCPFFSTHSDVTIELCCQALWES